VKSHNIAHVSAKCHGSGSLSLLQEKFEPFQAEVGLAFETGNTVAQTDLFQNQFFLPGHVVHTRDNTISNEVSQAGKLALNLR